MDRSRLLVAAAVAITRQPLRFVLLPQDEADPDRSGEAARACNGHPINHDHRRSTARARNYFPILNRKWQTSPSWTTYSLPSRRS